MIRKVAAFVIALGLVVYVIEAYLGTCDFPASGSQCLNNLDVLGQPFYAGAFGNMYSGGYYAPFAYAIAGVAVAICGAVVVAADSFRRVVKLPLRWLLVTMVGWPLVAAGLSVWVASLAESYICMEYCFNVYNSFVIEWGGIIAAFGGLTVVAIVALASQFRHAKQRRPYRWVLAMTAVVLIAGTLWSAGTAYSEYEQGISPLNWGASLVTMAGSIVVPVSPGSGTLSIMVRNAANAPISEIHVVGSSSLPQSTSITFTYNGGLVSFSNVLPIGATAIGSLQVGNVKVGNAYEMTIALMFVNNNNQTYALEITAGA